MRASPKVTVLVPVFNGEKFLRECMNSLLGQTLADFECLVIDDGSSDGSVSLVKSIKDKRIRLVENVRNMGGANVRNKGFELARGEYVAFMDCDDISVLDRLEKQVAFMEKHPEVGVCGSYMQVMNRDGKILEDQVWRCPTDPKIIARYLAVDCTLFNPTLITRKSVVIEHAVYHNPVFTAADDMDWYIRMARVTKLANIPEVLTYYRLHEHQETNRRKFISRRNTINLHLGLMLEEIKKFRPGVKGEIKPVTPEMNVVTFLQNMVLVDQLIARWPVPVEESGEEFQVYSTLKKHLNLMWMDIATYLPEYKLSIFRVVMQSSFFKSLPLSVKIGVLFKSLSI